MKFEWLIVRPGVIALSGTPIQVRREKVSFTDAPGYAVYEGDRKDNEWASLESAKNMAMRLAEDLFGLGIIMVTSDSHPPSSDSEASRAAANHPNAPENIGNGRETE